MDPNSKLLLVIDVGTRILEMAQRAVHRVWSGEQRLRSVVREGPPGTPELIAEGYEYPMTMSHKVGEQVQTWTERRLVVRSVRQAHAAEAALRTRVAKALGQIETFNQRGRGEKKPRHSNKMRGSKPGGGWWNAPLVG